MQNLIKMKKLLPADIYIYSDICIQPDQREYHRQNRCRQIFTDKKIKTYIRLLLKKIYTRIYLPMTNNTKPMLRTVTIV